MTREQIRALAALGCAYFFIGSTSLGVIGLLDEMAAGVGSTAPAIAQLVTIFAVVYALAAPCLQAVVGGMARRQLVSVGLVIVAVSCAVAATAESYGMVAASRIGMALGCALIGPTASAAAAALVSPEHRSTALAAVFTGLTLSTVLGVPLASWMGQTLGWRWAWGVLGVGAVMVAPLVWVTVPAANRGARATLSAFKAVLADRARALGVATTALQLAAQFVTYAFIAIWLTEYAGLPRSFIPAGLLLFGVAGVIGGVLSAQVERWLGAERTVQLCLALVAISLVVLWLAAGQLWIIAAGMALWSSAGLMIMAPLQTRLVGLSPEQSSLTLALNASAIYVGMSVGGALGGALYAGFGAGPLPLASAVVILLALVAFRASLVR